MHINEPFIKLCVGELEEFNESLADDNVPEISAISNELLSEAKRYQSQVHYLDLTEVAEPQTFFCTHILCTSQKK